jgi:hypothetical protein
VAYDRQFLRLTVGFGLMGTKEIAETGCTLTGGTSFNAVSALASPTDADLESFGTTLGATIHTAGLRWADYSAIQTVKLAAVDTSGHYLTAAREVDVIPEPVGATFHVIPQASVEVGLRSGSKIGRANYGKMYLPHTQFSLVTGSPNGSTADALATATAMAAWITGLNGAAGGWVGSPVVAVLSRVGSGTTKTVVEVDCGDITDTQRRRRDRLVEAYQVHGV